MLESPKGFHQTTNHQTTKPNHISHQTKPHFQSSNFQISIFKRQASSVLDTRRDSTKLQTTKPPSHQTNKPPTSKFKLQPPYTKPSNHQITKPPSHQFKFPISIFLNIILPTFNFQISNFQTSKFQFSNVQFPISHFHVVFQFPISNLVVWWLVV